VGPQEAGLLGGDGSSAMAATVEGRWLAMDLLARLLVTFFLYSIFGLV